MTRPLQIDAVDRASAWLVLRFYAVAGQAYRVQYTDVLPATAWQTLLDVPPPDGNGDLEVPDAAPGPGNRFYRLLLPVAP